MKRRISGTTPFLIPTMHVRRYFMKTTRFAFLLVLPALFILSSAGAAQTDEKEDSFQVTNTTDYQYGCDVQMVFSNGAEIEFKGIT